MRHAVDVRGAEVEDLARLVDARRRLAAHAQALLQDQPGDDGHRTRRDVVVVEARVVVVHPADQPDAHVLVEDHLLVGPLVRGVSDEVPPRRVVGGEPGDEVTKFVVAQQGILLSTRFKVRARAPAPAVPRWWLTASPPQGPATHRGNRLRRAINTRRSRSFPNPPTPAA